MDPKRTKTETIPLQQQHSNALQTTLWLGQARQPSGFVSGGTYKQRTASGLSPSVAKSLLQKALRRAGSLDDPAAGLIAVAALVEMFQQPEFYRQANQKTSPGDALRTNALNRLAVILVEDFNLALDRSQLTSWLNVLTRATWKPVTKKHARQPLSLEEAALMTYELSRTPHHCRLPSHLWTLYAMAKEGITERTVQKVLAEVPEAVSHAVLNTFGAPYTGTVLEPGPTFAMLRSALVEKSVPRAFAAMGMVVKRDDPSEKEAIWKAFAAPSDPLIQALCDAALHGATGEFRAFVQCALTMTLVPTTPVERPTTVPVDLAPVQYILDGQFYLDVSPDSIVHDKHTSSGLAKQRGTKHFVEKSARVVRRLPGPVVGDVDLFDVMENLYIALSRDL